MRAGYAVQRPVANEYLVRERDRRRARELLKIVVLVLPLTLALLGYISVHMAVLDEAYRVQVLERRLHDLTRLERRLRLEAARLGNPATVERRAVDELGMAPPTPEQVVFWREVGR